MGADEVGICGRNKEIADIQRFISDRIKSKRSGVLYVAGPPGTGKSMSVDYVLDQLSNVSKLKLNCLRALSSKGILTKICALLNLEKFTKFNETEMMSRIAKKLSSRTSESYVIVLDEMDQLPKSKSMSLIKTIFSLPKLENSKLILIGIANTLNMTAKHQIITTLTGKDDNHITKMLFKPYSTKDIKSILEWYLENEENYEEAVIDSRALDMIAAKFARENGDIRGALNALKSSIDDTNKKKCNLTIDESHYPTPPATPPATPCKDKTNIMSVANSIKKRSRSSHYQNDLFPFPQQIILTCIEKLTELSETSVVDKKVCEKLVTQTMGKFNISLSIDDYRGMLENLEVLGLVGFKKCRPRDKIVFKASESEMTSFVIRKDMILDVLR